MSTVVGERKSIKQIAKEFVEVYRTNIELKRLGSLYDLFGQMRQARDENPWNIYGYIAESVGLSIVSGTDRYISGSTSFMPSVVRRISIMKKRLQRVRISRIRRLGISSSNTRSTRCLRRGRILQRILSSSVDRTGVCSLIVCDFRLDLY